MKFIFDKNFPINATRILDIFDRQNEMRHCTDLFERGTADTVWLREISGMDNKSIVLSHDGRILRNKVERNVLSECKLSFVYLTKTWAQTPWNDFVWKITRIWPNIVKDVSRIRTPKVFQVTQSKVIIT